MNLLLELNQLCIIHCKYDYDCDCDCGSTITLQYIIKLGVMFHTYYWTKCHILIHYLIEFHVPTYY